MNESHAASSQFDRPPADTRVASDQGCRPGDRASRMDTYQTEQEAFWAGSFGDEYSRRNVGGQILASNLSFFARALAQARGFSSCIEFGANVGNNLRALKLLYPSQEQFALEINPTAAESLCQHVSRDNIVVGSMLDFQPTRTWELVLIKGVFIHLSPDSLPTAYDVVHAAASKYVLVAEYFNPTPVSVPYRGHSERLFKRDFAGEMLDRFDDLRLIDYGFSYHRDTHFPQDDITWFLLQKMI